MKLKLVAVILVVCMLLPMLFACDRGNSNDAQRQTEKQTENSTELPTDKTTEAPTDKTTEAPTDKATETPTEKPTEAPTDKPTEIPTDEPTETPTEQPTEHMHTEVIDEAVAPTCTETGLTEGKHCSECGKILVVQEVLPCTGHSFDSDKTCECGERMPTEGLSFTLINNDTEYEVSGKGTATDTDIVIPQTYNDLPVTRICSYAFYNCSSLTSITIPDSVTSIDEGAFSRCFSLVEIYNKSSLTMTAGGTDNGYIGYHALNVYTPTSGESKLHTTDDGYVFYVDGDTRYLVKYVGGETDITLPENCQGHNYKIYRYAFYDCDSLTSITIPDSVTSIGYDAFSYCDSLTSVTIPDSVTSIGDEAFFACDSLTSVTIGNSVTSIGYSAFFGYCSLVEVYNKSSLAITAGSPNNGEVGYYALNVYTPTSGASKLHTTDDGYIFYVDGDTRYLVKYAGGETNIILPENCQGHNYEIYVYAFYNCDSLTSITIPEGVTSIGEFAFFGCSSLTSVTIPDSVTSIGEYAFYDCDSLTSITIPDSVTSIGDSAFSGCLSLTSITVGENNTVYSSQDGILYDKEKTEFIHIPDDLQGDVTIPDGITSIGSYAFSGCSSLTSITIPEGVTSIGYNAFYGCDSLTNVHITDIAAWCGINFGDSCANPLYYAHNLYLNGKLVTDLVIPEGVTSIGDSAFEDCSSLTSITIPDSVTSIGWAAFYHCSSLTSVTFNGTKEEWKAISKGDYWNSDTGDYTIYCTDGTIAKNGTET